MSVQKDDVHILETQHLCCIHARPRQECGSWKQQVFIKGVQKTSEVLVDSQKDVLIDLLQLWVEEFEEIREQNDRLECFFVAVLFHKRPITNQNVTREFACTNTVVTSTHLGKNHVLQPLSITRSNGVARCKNSRFSVARFGLNRECPEDLSTPMAND